MDCAAVMRGNGLVKTKAVLKVDPLPGDKDVVVEEDHILGFEVHPDKVEGVQLVEEADHILSDEEESGGFLGLFQEFMLDYSTSCFEFGILLFYFVVWSVSSDFQLIG